MENGNGMWDWELASIGFGLFWNTNRAIMHRKFNVGSNERRSLCCRTAAVTLGATGRPETRKLGRARAVELRRSAAVKQACPVEREKAGAGEGNLGRAGQSMRDWTSLHVWQAPEKAKSRHWGVGETAGGKCMYAPCCTTGLEGPAQHQHPVRSLPQDLKQFVPGVLGEGLAWFTAATRRTSPEESPCGRTKPLKNGPGARCTTHDWPPCSRLPTDKLFGTFRTPCSATTTSSPPSAHHPLHTRPNNIASEKRG